MAVLEIKVTAAGFLLISFLSFGFSQEVPDEVVYTEVRKTLVLGATGVLRCRFKGAPNAVYWKKGNDLESAQPLLTWSYGQKSGSCYEDGRCDIDGNYSLVIKSVTSGDSGRYFCRVSNYKGILINNHTDVTITNTAVRTKSVVAAQKGRNAFLPCKMSIRPKKVAWVRGNNETLAFMDLSRLPARGGAGYEEGMFNMTNEYSLVIYDVVINQEDNYTCEVTDYDTGHIFQDDTMLAVFATPRVPFPSIAECPKEQQDSSSCALSIDSPTTLTCQVEGYYPHIDLFFLHGMERVEPLGTAKWNNSDGTISKRNTIEVIGPSDTPYECVAAGVILQGGRRSMVIHLVPDKDIWELGVPLAVILSVILLAVIISVTAIAIKRRKRPSGGRYKGVPMTDLLSKGRISNFELWTLVKTVEEARGSNTSTTLDKIISVLKKDGADCKESSAYLRLCKWKQQCADNIDQRKSVYHACHQVLSSEMKKQWRVHLSATEVTESDIEHILWQMREPNKIKRFLSALDIDPSPIFENDKEKELRQVIEQAKDLLLSWADEGNVNHPLVTFSLTLESLNFPNDFFELTSKDKGCLTPQEISEFIGSLHHNHIHRFIADSFLGLKGKRDPKTISDENRNTLFDACKMVSERLERRNDNNYEKRNWLKTFTGKRKSQTDAIKAPSSKWPSDGEIKEFASFIEPSMMPKICLKLDIDCPDHDANSEEKRVKVLMKWRDKVDGKPLSEKYQMLSAALKDGNIAGILPRLRNDFVQLTELIDLAFYLIMQDTIPFAEFCGYNLATLAFDRIPFLPEYFHKGTISLVIKFFQTYGKTPIRVERKKSRSELFEILEKRGFRQLFHRGILAYDMSYGELCAISKAMSDKDEEKEGDKNAGATGESDVNSNIDVKLDMQTVEWRRHETELKRVLAITDEDKVGSGVSSDRFEAIDLFRIWKEKPRLEPYNYRVALVKGLREVDRSHLSVDVIKGKYCTSGETSMQFIYKMVCGMNKEKLDALGKILGLGEPMSYTLVTCKKICDWVQKWTTSYSSDEWDDERKWKTMKEHADFNDELVKAGFLDLARETMTIEQNLRY